MIWSKLKKQYKTLLADSLMKRLDFHITENRKSDFDEGSAWITFEGKKIVTVAIPSFYDKEFNFSVETMNFTDAIKFCINNDIEKLKASTDPIVRGLAFLDRRMGQRLLKVGITDDLHPFR